MLAAAQGEKGESDVITILRIAYRFNMEVNEHE